jgi:hypothetical protein
MVRGPRSQSDVEKLRKAQNRIIEWASNEIGFIYQLHALSELKKPIEPLHLDSAAYLSEALLLEISYFLVAATLYGGRSKPYEDFKEKIGDFCRRFAELRDSHQVETIVIELTRRADELAAIQSELPTAYVLLSDSPIARKYLAAFSPHQSVSARFDHRSASDLLKANRESARRRRRSMGSDGTFPERFGNCS